jgi:thiol-disulfide isomerase/thioredoxin
VKRIALVLATLVGIVAFALLANRATRIPVTRAVSTNQDNRPAASPDFTLKDLEDHDVSLSQFNGKVVLVNFWATWCGPCRIEIPWLIELQEKYAARGFTVLGVAMDEEGKSAVAPFVQKERFKVAGTSQSMNYPVVLGNDATADKFGGLVGFPTSLLISRDGRVAKRVDGLVGYDEIDEAIRSQLETNGNRQPLATPGAGSD